jgi:hypothetical protein
VVVEVGLAVQLHLHEMVLLVDQVEAQPTMELEPLVHLDKVMQVELEVKQIIMVVLVEVVQALLD